MGLVSPELPRTVVSVKMVRKPKTPASDSYVALTPVLARLLALWRKETPYAQETDWVFASQKTHGKTPRFGGMLVRGYLYPAAEHAEIIFRQKDGSYVDSTSRKVTRFGFHNLRKADILNSEQLR
jgi:hypothetical protein